MSQRVLIARPLWPVLRKAGALLSRDGMSVEESPSWGRLLDPDLPVSDLGLVLLGEHGDAASETEALRRFRSRKGGLGIPLVLVGGFSALVRAREFLSAGADLVVPADVLPEELVERAMPLLRYSGLYQALSLQNRELRDQSLRDELTGLPNRRHFSMDLSRNLEMARRIGRALSCILIDIDDFKKVNDTWGHPAGDAVIRQFGEILSAAKRTYDTVARLGGDEFAWLLLDATPEQAIRAAARARRKVVEADFRLGGEGTARLTATFGVSSVLSGAEICGDDLVANADRALYWGKESGKNAIRFYPPKQGTTDAANHPHVS